MNRIRVLIITQDDPMYVRLFFEEFLATPAPEIELCGVVISPALGKKGTVALAKQMLEFYGPLDFVTVASRFALCKVMNRIPKFLRQGPGYTIEQVCSTYGVPVSKVKNVNSPEFVDSIRANRIDLVISVAAPQIFRAALIGAPPKGCINIHNSRLPKYRGMMPNFWQMLHGEKSVGTTIHRINAALDDGAILAQMDTPILPRESLDSLIRRTKREGAHFMRRTLAALSRGEIVEQPNPSENSSYFSFPKAADVKAFRSRGLRLV